MYISTGMRGRVRIVAVAGLADVAELRAGEEGGAAAAKARDEENDSEAVWSTAVKIYALSSSAPAISLMACVYVLSANVVPSAIPAAATFHKR